MNQITLYYTLRKNASQTNYIFKCGKLYQLLSKSKSLINFIYPLLLNLSWKSLWWTYPSHFSWIFLVIYWACSWAFSKGCSRVKSLARIYWYFVNFDVWNRLMTSIIRRSGYVNVYHSCIYRYKIYVCALTIT